MIKSDYFLVTTIKDEESNLRNLFSSVFRQTILPRLWYVINDGSKDNSLNIISEFKEKFPDIIIVESMEEGFRDISWRYHFLIERGIKGVIRIGAENKLNWNYIGILDGDIIINTDVYYEALIQFCNNSRHKIGVISGKLLSLGDNNRIVVEKRSINRPTGAARLMSREIESLIRDYPICPSADAIILQRARRNGFENRIVKEVSVTQSRMTSSAEGVDIGYQKMAFSKYFLGHTIFFALLYTMKLLILTRSGTAFIFLRAFLTLRTQKAKKIDDLSIIEYRKHYIINRISERFLSFKKK